MRVGCVSPVNVLRESYVTNAGGVFPQQVHVGGQESCADGCGPLGVD